MVRKHFLFLLFSWLLLVMNACGNAESSDHAETEEKKTMAQKIQIQLDGRVFSAVLYENASAKDFLAQLPLTLTLSDFNGTEKIADLPKRISEEGAPAGFKPEAGDIAYYAPWGNLAIFYREFRYSERLIRIGKIEGDGLKFLRNCDNRKIEIRPVDSH